MNSWLASLYKLLVLQTVICKNFEDNSNGTVNEYTRDNSGSGGLSRRKRFIIFPEGSSLQLIFCNQITAVIPIGDIFLFGYTAALAWQLPSDPKYIYMFKELGEPTRRSDQVKNMMNYLDEDGKNIAKIPFQKRIIVNPTFAKRNADNYQQSYKEKLKIKIEREKFHEKHINRDYLKAGHKDGDTIEFHRTNRLELYKKIEKLLNALGRDGRQCVLYKLCETAQLRRGQGTFLQEFLTVVFTLPKGQDLDEDVAKEYDAAHTASKDCIERYPRCLGNL